MKTKDNLWDTLIVAILIMTIAAMCSCTKQPIKYWRSDTSLNVTSINLPEPQLTKEQLERLYGVTITHDHRGEIWHVKRHK